MKTLPELLQERAELIKQQAALVNAAKAEARTLTADEANRFDVLDTQIESMDKEIAAQEQHQARMQKAANRQQDLDRPQAGGRRPDIKVGNDRATEKPWNSFGHFLQAVYAAGQQHVQPHEWDSRLKFVQAAATGLGSVTPADGGFLVGHEMATDLVSRGYEQSMLAPLCRKVGIGEGADGLSVNTVDETSRATGSRWGGVQMYWRAEADTVTASKPKFRRLDIPLEDLMGLCYATNGLLRDAVALGNVVRTAFAEETAWMLDNGIVRGTGAGQMTGYLNSSARVIVDKVAGQAATTIETKNLSQMWARIWARSRKNAVWLINQDIEPELDELAITVGTGGLEPRFVTYGPEGTLRIKGRPVIAIEQASTLGTEGDISVVDLSQYVLIDKDDPQVAESIHVRFIYGENTFRFIYRVNGQPFWVSVLTPANGSNTQSPYVTLQTRS